MRREGRSTGLAAFILVTYVGLLAFDLWFLVARPDASWERKLGLIFGILGLYNFAFGFFSQTDVFKRISFLDENELTSPNLFKFTKANLAAMAIVTQTFSLSVDPLKLRSLIERSTSSVVVLAGAVAFLVEALAGMVLGVLGFLAVLVSIALYLVVVAPLAYTAYAVASILVDGVEPDLEPKPGEDPRLHEIRAVVQEHKPIVRTVFVAVPSTVFSLILGATSLL